MSRLLPLISIVLLCAIDASAQEILFESQIRPILKAHCFHCHGEDGATEGGLDLRLRRWIVAGGESGPAIEIGDSDTSLLLDRIESGDMPPGDQSLPQDEIETLRAWINQGANTARPEPESLSSEGQITDEERRFWAFRPITRPAVPDVENRSLTQTPIDRFILAQLEEQGLKFSPLANRTSLARRMHIGLLGIPPEPELTQRLVADNSPVAFRRFIEQLLASPAYGERWGRHWLDVAGYADSEGYSEEDRVRESAFRYRDYVIRSLNQDKGFDQFLCEQLAGDELIDDRSFQNLSTEDQDRLIATGFLRMAPDGTGSGGIDQNVARNQTIADTLDIVSTSLMAMTVACAQCHNHRYDPITQADYYRIRAIFEPALDWKAWKTPAQRKVSLYSDAERAKKKQIEQRVAAVESERKEKTEFYIHRTLEEELENAAPEFRDKLRAAYKTPTRERTEAQTKLLQEHPTIQNISSGSLYLYDQRRDERARKLEAEAKSKETQLIQNVREQGLKEAGDETRGDLQLAIQTESAKRTETQNALLSHHPAAVASVSNLAEFDPDGFAEVLALREQAADLRSSKAVDDLKRYTDQIAEIRKQIPPEGFVRALTEPDNHRPKTFLFYRGDHGQPREALGPGGLSVLGAADSIPPEIADRASSGRRLAFAKHLTDGNHRLVARVIVNRVWAQHFGQGIVRSLGDFGVLGDRPTHPELLDWLASELMDSGWQLKHIHRLILNSRVYQQSSRRNHELDTKDPDNTLLARMPLRRLDSESVRDSLLAITGELNREMYGDPVPVREDGVGQIVIGNEALDGERKPVAGEQLGGAIARRSIYVQVRRSRPLAVLETFDAPRMTPNCAERAVSNVAPQPLMMMNSDFVVERARRLASRVRRETGEDLDAQVNRAWTLVFSVSPTEDEISLSRDYIARQSSTLDEQTDPLETFCHALISTNQLLYVD